MDTTDSLITFDARGFCDHCSNFYDNILPHWDTGPAGEAIMAAKIDEIKARNKDKDFDCLIGLSGGVDSSYLVYVAVEKFGLRPLLYHVDGGWNSQQAVNNIERLVDGLNLDLFTEVIDWNEMRDLQLAFFKAQVPHLDAPQDMAFFGGLYRYAIKNDVKYILTGANYSTECIREPLEWDYHKSDARQMRDIHRKFGSVPLKTFPVVDIFTNRIYYRYIKGLTVVKPLNHVPYIKADAMDELVERFGWQRYAHKHYESRFTRFYEGYWLPTKFGFDKRRVHFSSVILTKQMSRDEALKRMEEPAYDPETIAEDFEYIATKLGMSVAELDALHKGPCKTFRDYKNNMPLIALGTAVSRLLGIERTVIR